MKFSIVTCATAEEWKRGCQQLYGLSSSKRLDDLAEKLENLVFSATDEVGDTFQAELEFPLGEFILCLEEVRPYWSSEHTELSDVVYALTIA